MVEIGFDDEVDRGRVSYINRAARLYASVIAPSEGIVFADEPKAVSAVKIIHGAPVGIVIRTDAIFVGRKGGAALRCFSCER